MHRSASGARRHRVAEVDLLEVVRPLVASRSGILPGAGQLFSFFQFRFSSSKSCLSIEQTLSNPASGRLLGLETLLPDLKLGEVDLVRVEVRPVHAGELTTPPTETRQEPHIPVPSTH